MKVKLIAHTPQPEKVVAAAAKLCYANTGIDELLEGLDAEKSRDFVRMLAELGHESPTEHASFTFAAEGVSRSLLAQITRHRIASFSVQSQRYVKMDAFAYVLPPEIEKIPEAKALFEQAMNDEAARYEQLTEILKKEHEEAYLKEGLAQKEATSKAEKKAIEDARFLLPNGCSTKMIFTMNARSLNHFFILRCCNRAQWEIHALADEMLKLAFAAAPALFAKAGPSCAAGPCGEGKMSCGRAAEMRAAYAALRAQACGGEE
ncbi:FAD-dependent thymidylate synthase [Ruminococcaceae bacterium OttesenSCG-928-I18]|nr:FAD-dependent thymidylate synthase [Ruminococcaceae bacterium OttesenSCG-928-I18]